MRVGSNMSQKLPENGKKQVKEETAGGIETDRRRQRNRI